jgi:hypothetical protein
MKPRSVSIEVLLAAALAAAAGLGACSRQDPPAGMAQTDSAADRTNRSGADGGGDGPTALSPADKARAADMSASAAASTVYSSQTPGTSPMPTSAPVPSQGRTNKIEGAGQK